jgi:hypothetical protein
MSHSFYRKGLGLLINSYTLNGEVWAGAFGKGVNKISNGKITNYPTNDGLAAELVLSIYGTKDAVPAAFTYLILREK